VQVVPVVGVLWACAPGDAAAQGVWNVPDLPTGVESGFELGQRLSRGGHLSPRSVSAASIAWRRSVGVMARTTRGGLQRGRRA
jgi:hypothetical protein